MASNDSSGMTILVIKHSALGDIVLETGMMKAIRDRHPGAWMALMTKAAFAEFGRSMGLFDEVIVDNRKELDFGAWKRIVKDTLADRRWDFIYDLQSNNRTLCRYYPLAKFLTRNPLRWGRRVAGGFDFMVTPAKSPFIWKFARIERVALEPHAPDLSFCHGPKVHFGILPERYILLIPGCSAGHPYKKWPTDRYRELSRRYGELGVSSVVMGTKAEEQEISAIVRDNPHAVDFMGKSALADIPELARGAELVVGNDTGPSHMARIAGAKTITLFCRTTESSAREAPNAVNIIRDRICDITVDEVISAARSLNMV